ncbi:MAG: carbonic anhydrase [Pirellulaceae bacterium]|jgi:carbonic anhydrase
MTLPLLAPTEHLLSPREFGTKTEFMSEIGQGDEPVAIMLTCWELGVAPDQVSHANPGEIIITQNPGGLVHAVDQGQCAALDSILFGLSQSSIRHLVVCGHTLCKTLSLLITEDDEKKNPFGEYLLGVRQRLDETYYDRRPIDWQGIIVQEAVLQQLANLRSHMYIQSRLQEGSLRMHGWIRDDQTATIASYDPVTGQFCD